jgi:hypothetical protein
MTDWRAQLKRKSDEGLGWWRFSDYVIEDGMIIPAPGGRPVPYDPWLDRHRADAESQRNNRVEITDDPALDLLRLARKLASLPEIAAEAPIEASDQQQEAILQFARRYGLLGLFHDYVFQLPEPGTTRIWVRPRGQWAFADSDLHSDDPACLVWETDSEGHILATIRFSEIAEGFFLPSMPTPLPYPISKEFFQHYGEPVTLFVGMIRVLCQAFAQAMANHWDALNVLVDSASIAYRPDGTARYGSLFTSLADMLWRDLEDGFGFRVCRECEDMMRTQNRRAIYCSRQCQWNATQKARRRRLASAEKKKSRNRKGGSR